MNTKFFSYDATHPKLRSKADAAGPKKAVKKQVKKPGTRLAIFLNSGEFPSIQEDAPVQIPRSIKSRACIGRFIGLYFDLKEIVSRR